MMRHIAYLRYLLRHKWFVFLACLKCDVPLWRAIIHDWHKFLPSEWFPYVEYFYGEWKILKNTEPDDFRYWQVKGKVDAEFDHAWNKHQKRGKHHWQYWLITFDDGGTKPLQIPKTYADEMIADWWGAGRAINGNWDAITWYHKNKQNMNLHERTRAYVESTLASQKCDFNTPEMVAQRIRILGY